MLSISMRYTTVTTSLLKICTDVTSRSGIPWEPALTVKQQRLAKKLKVEEKARNTARGADLAGTQLRKRKNPQEIESV